MYNKNMIKDSARPDRESKSTTGIEEKDAMSFHSTCSTTISRMSASKKRKKHFGEGGGDAKRAKEGQDVTYGARMLNRLSHDVRTSLRVFVSPIYEYLLEKIVREISAEDATERKEETRRRKDSETERIDASEKISAVELLRRVSVRGRLEKWFPVRYFESYRIVEQLFLCVGTLTTCETLEKAESTNATSSVRRTSSRSGGAEDVEETRHLDIERLKNAGFHLLCKIGRKLR